MPPAVSIESRVTTSLRALWPNLTGAPLFTRVSPSILVPMHVSIDSAPFEVWQTDKTEVPAILKVLEEDAVGVVPFSNIVAASAQAARHSIGPNLLASDADSATLLFEKLQSPDWVQARRDDLDDQDRLAAVISAKRSFHQTEKLALTRSPFDLVEIYMEIAHKIIREDGPLTQAQPICEILPWINYFRDAFQTAGTDVAPTHGENALSNIFLSPDNKVRLVDFDRAVNADPIYDLASFCLEVCHNDDEIQRIVSMYNQAPDPKLLARTRIYMIVDDFVWGLWALVGHYTSPRSNSIEFYKYAHKRFLRSQYWLKHWDIAAQLKQF